MPAPDGEHDQRASGSQRHERHRPREDIETLSSGRGQNFLAVLAAKVGDNFSSAHPMREHRVDLFAHRHREFAIRMVAVGDGETASALARERLGDFLLTGFGSGGRYRYGRQQCATNHRDTDYRDQ